MCWGPFERILPDLILSIVFIGAALLSMFAKFPETFGEILPFIYFLIEALICWCLQIPTFLGSCQSSNHVLFGIILIMHDSLLATCCLVIKVKDLLWK